MELIIYIVLFLGWFIIGYLTAWIYEMTNESKTVQLIANILIFGYPILCSLGILIYEDKLSEIKLIFGLGAVISFLYLLFYLYSKKEYENFFIRQLNKLLLKVGGKTTEETEEVDYPLFAAFMTIILLLISVFIIDTTTGIFVFILSKLYNYWYSLLSIIFTYFCVSIWFKKNIRIIVKIILSILAILSIYLFVDFKDSMKIELKYKSLIFKYLDANNEQ